MEPLEQFFSQYSEFDYDPTQSASQQFHRLQKKSGWGRNNPEQKDAWEDYLGALVKQFNLSYGTDEDDLDAWHRLLVRVGVTDMPDNVRECKHIIEGTFINLVDLVDARDDPTGKIRCFPSEVELSSYTISERKIFPRNHVFAGSLLKYLLRHIFSPDKSRGTRRNPIVVPD